MIIVSILCKLNNTISILQKCSLIYVLFFKKSQNKGKKNRERKIILMVLGWAFSVIYSNLHQGDCAFKILYVAWNSCVQHLVNMRSSDQPEPGKLVPYWLSTFTIM